MNGRADLQGAAMRFGVLRRGVQHVVARQGVPDVSGPFCGRHCVVHSDRSDLWDEHCRKLLIEVGFRALESWPSCSVHADLKL